MNLAGATELGNTGGFPWAFLVAQAKGEWRLRCRVAKRVGWFWGEASGRPKIGKWRRSKNGL